MRGRRTGRAQRRAQSARCVRRAAARWRGVRCSSWCVLRGVRPRPSAGGAFGVIMCGPSPKPVNVAAVTVHSLDSPSDSLRQQRRRPASQHRTETSHAYEIREPIPVGAPCPHPNKGHTPQPYLLCKKFTKTSKMIRNTKQREFFTHPYIL